MVSLYDPNAVCSFCGKVGALKLPAGFFCMKHQEMGRAPQETRNTTIAPPTAELGAKS